jgi:predicted Ser/Thr protein kinase
MSGQTDPLFWKRARAAFDAIADLPPSQREAQLAALCEGDAALRAEVESLLAHADTPDAVPAILERAAQRVFDGSALNVGHSILHYEVTAELGQGGMGVVWKATDNTLGREVAIKVLPSAVSRDPVRLARLDREAKLLAALNHPNVASIYSLHESNGTRFLTMEYVEGDDLATRLARQPMPLPDVLSIARQIADGLEEAHEKGVVHRDLKPANVKITPAGKVKVLDFGLAKATGRDAGIERSETRADDGTASALTTRAGFVLGTAAYMAPEQTRGLPVDRRADVWSFGVLLFEMLSRQRPFEGATTTDVLSAVVANEPDWTRLPPATPPRLERLIRRCLVKDPRQRLRDIGEARLELEALIGGGDDAPAARPPGSSRRRDATMAILGAAAAAALAVWLLWPAAAGDPGMQRFNVVLPPGLRIEDALDANRQTMALSRDGRQLAFTTRDTARRKQIYLRRMDQVDAAPVPGTEGADMPFFSPDGLQLGFFSEGKLKRVPVAGGPPAIVCDAAEARGATWGDDGTIVFAPGAFSGLARVAATGGTPAPLTTLNRSGEEGHRWPVLLPGGRAAVFATVPVGRREQDATIDVVRLDTGGRRTLVRGGLYPRYLDGHLLYASDGRIVAAPFDLGALATIGPAVPVLNDVRIDLQPDPRILMDVSAAGVLAYVPGAAGVAERELVWLDRNGVATAIVNEKRPYRGAQLAPDGRSLAVLIDSPPTTSLWTHSLERRTWNRLTFDQDVSTPAWTPDSARIVYSADGLRRTYVVAADGGEKPVRLLATSPTAATCPRSRRAGGWC